MEGGLANCGGMGALLAGPDHGWLWSLSVVGGGALHGHHCPCRGRGCCMSSFVRCLAIGTALWCAMPKVLGLVDSGGMGVLLAPSDSRWLWWCIVLHRLVVCLVAHGHGFARWQCWGWPYLQGGLAAGGLCPIIVVVGGTPSHFSSGIG